MVVKSRMVLGMLVDADVIAGVFRSTWLKSVTLLRASQMLVVYGGDVWWT